MTQRTGLSPFGVRWTSLLKNITMNDLLELVDYLSLGAVVAAALPLVPRQKGWLRRLARMPIVCVGVWFGLVVILYLGRSMLGEGYAWILYGGLVSIVFASLGGAGYLGWATWHLTAPPESRRTSAPYLVYTLCALAVGGGLLMTDTQKPGVVAVVMLVYAVIGVGVRIVALRRGKT